jgi:hypothetical protein
MGSYGKILWRRNNGILMVFLNNNAIDLVIVLTGAIWLAGVAFSTSVRRNRSAIQVLQPAP